MTKISVLGLLLAAFSYGVSASDKDVKDAPAEGAAIADDLNKDQVKEDEAKVEEKDEAKAEDTADKKDEADKDKKCDKKHKKNKKHKKDNCDKKDDDKLNKPFLV